MPSAGAPRCPNCPYGKFRTELASVGLRERWADREGACWSYGRDGCAWWHLCQQCHLIDRPYDFRTRNASSRPGVAWHTFKGDVDISIDGFKGGGCLQEGCSRVPGAALAWPAHATALPPVHPPAQKSPNNPPDRAAARQSPDNHPTIHPTITRQIEKATLSMIL